MNSTTRLLLAIIWLTSATGVCRAELRTEFLKKQALATGLVPAKSMSGKINEKKSRFGGKLFRSTLLSFNGDTSCETCHQDRFSSADGLPNAVGVGGKGFGKERMASGGAVVPRNTLPLWGRGTPEFNTFFWDGKVTREENKIVSQFGDNPPSKNALAVAAHLPFVEFREMVVDDDSTSPFRREDPKAAGELYRELSRRIVDDPELGPEYMSLYPDSSGFGFSTIPDAIAEFIRDRFRIEETKLHRFVFESAELTTNEIAGGVIFYGKGRCFACHSGSMFSDQKFHAIPYVGAGFGKNGFGQDFGRYNVSFDPRDLHKVRTPPLFNVEKTAPYLHTGAAPDMKSAIIAHFDPLANTIPKSGREREVWYQRLRAWTGNSFHVPSLDDNEVDELIAFLRTLSFEDVRQQTKGQ